MVQQNRGRREPGPARLTMETTDMRRALLALSAFLLLVPAAAFAQPNQFEITPFAGYRLDGDIDASSDLGFNRDVQVDESGVYGVLFDVGFTPNWSIELMANRQDTSFSVDEGLLSPTTKLGDVTLSYFQAGFLFQAGAGQVKPFFVITGGRARIEPDFPELDAENYFAGTLGGGVKIFLSPNVGVRLEARGYWTNLDTDYHDRYDRYDSSGDLIQGEASAGLILSF